MVKCLIFFGICPLLYLTNQDGMGTFPAKGDPALSWRTVYRVHPAADLFPMMPEAELAELQKDIEGHGVRVPIGLYIEKDANGRGVETWLIDGRNRLEAAERAGRDLRQIPTTRIHCSDPVTWIIALNIRRRHLTKQQVADLIREAHKAGEAERLKRKADEYVTPEGEVVFRQAGEKRKTSKRGRVEGRKRDPVKAAMLATAKEVGISPRTMERSIAKDSASKEKMPKRKRRSDAEIERDKFERLIDHIDFTPELWAPSDAALALLSEEKRIFALKILSEHQERVTKLIERLRSKSMKAA
jgi:hypothetical protein